MSFQTDVRRTLNKIEIQMGVMNSELKEHTRRSTFLEERVAPLEQSHVFFNKLAKTILALSTLGASLGAIYHYFLLK